MKTRDEQAEEYAKTMKEEFGYPELVDVFKAFKQGWNAALASLWRDASKELPETGYKCVVLTSYEGIYIGTFDVKCKCWCNMYNSGIYSVTHWMPIPDLP